MSSHGTFEPTMKCRSASRPGSASRVPSRNPRISGAASSRLKIGEPQHPAKNRRTPGLDSQLLRRSSPSRKTRSVAVTPEVVPKLDPECLRHRQQWQRVIGPTRSPRISYRTRPHAHEPASMLSSSCHLSWRLTRAEPSVACSRGLSSRWRDGELRAPPLRYRDNRPSTERVSEIHRRTARMAPSSGVTQIVAGMTSGLCNHHSRSVRVGLRSSSKIRPPGRVIETVTSW